MSCDKWTKQLLNKVGIEDMTDIIPPVVEADEDDPYFYIKFMSEGGKRDDEQGLAFRAFLEKHKVPFDSDRPRSYREVDIQAFEAAFGMKVE